MKNKASADNAASYAKKTLERRRAALLKKFEAGKKLSDADLLEIGLRGDTENHPNVVAGLEAIARIISNTFKIQCDRRYVHQWRKRPLRPFPPPHSGNLWNVPECLDWYRREILTPGDGSEHDLFQRAASERARGDIAAEEHKAWQREVERGAWIKKSDHARALAGAARLVQTLFDREVEIDGPRAGADILRNLGVSAETITEWQRQMVAHGIAFLDRRRREFGRSNDPSSETASTARPERKGNV